MSLKIVVAVILSVEYVYGKASIPEDGRLDFKGLATKYGLKCEEHEVVTEDGYILTMFQVPGDKTRPVLLLHGIIDTGDAYMIRGNASLVVALVKNGYDVWIGNVRGTEYSRRHKQFNPDIHMEYWNFSFHEIGLWDVSAKIDYILNKTGQTQISCIGHSQGTSAFFVLNSIRPEYNEKIKLLVALAPIAFLHYLTASPVKEAIMAWPYIYKLLKTYRKEEILGKNTLERYIFEIVCSHENAYKWCVKGLLMSVNGYDLQELEPEFWYSLVGHYPAGTSIKCFSHYQQIWTKKKFCQFDYNKDMNLAIYNSSVPPEYDLSKVTTRVALVTGANDLMAPLKGVKRLKRHLPNLVEFIVLNRETANHIDFLWGKHTNKYLFPHITNLLQKYT
ncbi:unnamed protein product [Diatraea saccharalis]|uniref:Lipase n=1 Tax=Diatraea saccharalis TaxID=40085 RepID=A0A9N9W9U6_9NEOP|nr:unnamed protein product [Diatraea saccharalis]